MIKIFLIRRADNYRLANMLYCAIVESCDIYETSMADKASILGAVGSCLVRPYDLLMCDQVVQVMKQVGLQAM